MITSSPGSSNPSIAAIIASVAPQVTVTWVSGSIAPQPGKWRTVDSAIASLSGFEPHVIAYWLMSASTAAATAALSSGGQAKSGKPCARLTAPAATARRFISRMTDSVNRSAFAEMRGRVMSRESTTSVAESDVADELVFDLLEDGRVDGQLA